MAQLDKVFTAQFIDPTIDSGAPILGLDVTFTIREALSWTLILDEVDATEIGWGWYNYVFEWMRFDIDYVYSFNPNDARAIVESGFVDKRLNYLDKPLSAIIGSFMVNKSSQYDFWMEDRLNLKKLVEKMEEMEKKETNLEPLIEKIDAIRIPEPTKVEEIEAKKVAKQVSTVEKLLKDYIKEDNDSKQDLWAIAEEFKQLILDEKKRQAEDRKREAEEKKREAEEAKKEEEEIKSEFQKQEEAENEAKRLVLEEEIKFLDEQKKEKEKELKSL